MIWPVLRRARSRGVSSLPRLTKGQAEYLETPALLFGAYEAAHDGIETGDLAPIGIPRHRMEEHGLLGARSPGSRILNGKRRLSKRHIRLPCERSAGNRACPGRSLLERLRDVCRSLHGQEIRFFVLEGASTSTPDRGHAGECAATAGGAIRLRYPQRRDDGPGGPSIPAMYARLRADGLRGSRDRARCNRSGRR